MKTTCRSWKKRLLAIPLLIALLVNGCSVTSPVNLPEQVSQVFPFIVEPTRTPFQPVPPTPIPPTPTPIPSPTPEPVREMIFWLDESLPPLLRQSLVLPNGAKLTGTAEESNLQIGAIRGSAQSTWIYALVAPYPTVTDEVSLADLRQAWNGGGSATFGSQPILMSASTRAAFTAWWGAPAENGIQIVAEEDISSTAWAARPTWAIVPFEDLEPGWKVLRVDGQSPIDKNFNPAEYPLTIWFGVTGNDQAMFLLNQSGAQASLFPVTNRDPSKLTVMVMTGVTALARATGFKMDTLGTTYPARDIHSWLYDADLTHISNEVSFNPECPLANPNSTSVMFCSRPEYIELLDYIGTDIVELSGNHNNDWGRRWFNYSLDLYEERGWTIFAGGANIQEAMQPATIEHNGNKFAFIGCNPVGPGGVWATETEPGVAPCDLDWMAEQVSQKKAEGYLLIVTFQHFERYVFEPSPQQERDFRAMVDAGAVIVSGSHSHFPQYMELYNGAFIHYGLGNLFFDQMDIPVKGTRREFVDRHVFYDGRHISTELLTAMLEDYARPRPMTAEERQLFLTEIFTAAKW